MNDLIQTIQVLTPEEVDLVNKEIDKKEFTLNSVGFSDETGQPRVDSSVRSSSGCFLFNTEKASQVIHEGMNKALLQYHSKLVGIHPTFDGYPVPGGYMTTSNR